MLAVTDYFTKWVEIFAVPDKSVVTCAVVILNEVIVQFGCPYSIHLEQGCNYESAIFSKLCGLLQIRKTRTSAGHPSCNGQVEHFNSSLMYDKVLLERTAKRMDQHLVCLAAAYWATPMKAQV